MNAQTFHDSDFLALARDHGAWSEATFGPSEMRGPVGSLRHLAREVEEAIAAPFDPSEYADLLLLILDASRRAGLPAPHLVSAAFDKLEVCKGREWPVGETDQPVEHVRSDAADGSGNPPGPLLSHPLAKPEASAADFLRIAEGMLGKTIWADRLWRNAESADPGLRLGQAVVVRFLRKGIPGGAFAVVARRRYQLPSIIRICARRGEAESVAAHWNAKPFT